VTDDFSSLSSTIVGAPLQVQIQPGAVFKVDIEVDEHTASPAATFSDANSLLPGQSVLVHRVSGDGSAGNPLVTDRIRLQDTRLTGPVQTKVDANTFTLDVSGGAVFQLAGVCTITVDASHARFEGISGVSALNVSPTPDIVSVRGWLFKQTSGSPLLIATKVRKH